MQNQSQFLRPRVGPDLSFPDLTSRVAEHSARCFSFSDVLDSLQSNGLIVLTTLATAKAKSDTDHPKEPFLGDLNSERL
jgi:hypothetical protein